MKRKIAATTITALVWLTIALVGLPAIAQAPAATAFNYDPRVAAMIAQVQSSQVYSYAAHLSGEVSTLIGGVPFTITTRNTGSGVPILQATQYVLEHLQRQGLTAGYHNWTNCGRSNRNVVGVLTGTLTPNEIVLITAHLDDMPSSGRAPGADDNASGSVGVMLAAEIMSQYRFERTLRFVFFTGEEQGLCGSEVYAADIAAAGDDVVAVYNMDMIAYDSLNGPTLRLHTRTTSNPGYPGDLAIAGVFTNVVNTYGLSSVLTPIIDPDGISASDHYPFWQNGYAAILAIEDDVNDFNAYYHTINDDLSHINLTYFTNFVKASVGTAAHLARPFSNFATVRGSVVRATNGSPIAGADVTAYGSVTRTGNTQTDFFGVYALALIEGPYTVTASAYGFAPQTVGGVVAQANVTTTQNFMLSAVSAHTVTGQVRDALTLAPLSATIVISGYPYNSVQTDAAGKYQVQLAEAMLYTFHVDAQVSGYQSVDRAVGPLTADRIEDFALQADLVKCNAPGYALLGVNEAFSSSGLPANWTTIGPGWSFNDPGGRGNQTGGSGNFASADSDYAGNVDMNTELRTPVMNLSTLQAVTLTFKSDFRYYSAGGSEVADVDVSVTGASGPWTNVWRRSGADDRGPKTYAIDLTALAGQQANVMIRFRYHNAHYDWWWQIDDVQLGICAVPMLYSVTLAPTSASQTALAGTVVTYSLALTNTGNVVDTYQVALSGNQWPAQMTPLSITLAAQSNGNLTATVGIPITATASQSDTLHLALTGSGAAAYANLTTTAIGITPLTFEVYLPLIIK